MRVTFRPLERDDFPDPRTLDLIMWSLRLPLLREARAEESVCSICGREAERAVKQKSHNTYVCPEGHKWKSLPLESARLDALITEGERALGILPEGKDA